MTETTETSAWNLIIPKMKLCTKEINRLKAVTHKLHKENALFFKLKLLLLVSYCSTTVLEQLPKQQQQQNTQTHTKSCHTEKMTAQNLKVKLFP